ncbi:hypothetical protein MRX96_002415 [Rhipicephalus microplus]
MSASNETRTGGAVDPLLKTMTELCGPTTEMLVSYEDRDNEANSAAVARFLRGCRQHFLVEERTTGAQASGRRGCGSRCVEARPDGQLGVTQIGNH